MTDRHRTRFAPGPATVVVADAAVALVAGEPTSVAVAAITAGLAAGTRLDVLLTELSSLGFGTLPSFAIVTVDDAGIHIIHRGTVEVRTLDGDGTATVFHRPMVSTWREESVDAADIVEIELRDLDVLTVDLPFWLDGNGVVPGARLSWPVTLSSVAEVSPIGPAPTVGPAPDPDPDPALDPALDPEPEPALDPEPEPELHSEPEPDPEPATAAEPETEPTPEPEAVPDATPFPAPAALGEADDLDFANFMDHTQFRRAEDAAVRPVESDAMSHPPSEQPALMPPPTIYMSLDTIMADSTLGPTGMPMIDGVPGAVASASVANDADHDGHTVARPRRRPAVSAPVAGSDNGATGVMVQAVFCPQNHPNRSNASACRVCGATVSDRMTRSTPRPSLGTLRFSTNQTASLDGPLLIGRNPPSGQLVDGEKASIIEIDNSELSRLHAAIHVVEWHVHVADQGSTNGTVVTVPGRPPQTLRPFEKVQISPGTTVDLGGAVTFTFDGG